MAFPSIVKFTAAGQLLNQSITFSSLLQVMGDYITGITNHAISKGYTVAGSSNGTTGAMDGVNRCTAAAGFATRATNTTTAQSWIVITAANGAQTCFAYVGASNDVARISCSPSGAFVAAGTATFTPTATDEVIGSVSTTLIGSTASGNRVFDVWIDSAHNGWRAAIFSANVLCGSVIGTELITATYLGGGITFSPAVWCFAQSPAQCSSAAGLMGAYSASTIGGVTRMTVSGTPTTINLGHSAKIFGNQTTAENGVAQELNGSNFLLRAIGVYSNTSGARGDVGDRYDWYLDNELKACGELDASKNWLYVNNSASSGSVPGLLLPWDGSSAWVGS